MANTKKAIKKLFDETLNGNFYLENSDSSLEFIRKCEKNDKLVEHNRTFWGFSKLKNDNGDELNSIRMVFALREDSKKVKNSSKIMELISELEEVLIELDDCQVYRIDGFMYLDTLKNY